MWQQVIALCQADLHWYLLSTDQVDIYSLQLLKPLNNIQPKNVTVGDCYWIETYKTASL